MKTHLNKGIMLKQTGMGSGSGKTGFPRIEPVYQQQVVLTMTFRESGKIHGFSRISRVLVPKIRVNPWTVCKRPDVISASVEPV
jgi:hypothetical protein